jgi:tetratricopeptide (TPR) repeat protein
MKKIVFAIICIFLIVSSPVSASSIGILNIENDPRNLGEALIINVDHVEPTVIASDLFMSNDYEAYVFLKGTTLGTFLFGTNSPDTAPFFGDLKIRNIRLTHDRDSARYIAGLSQIKRPKGKELIVDSTGNVDLGYTKVRFRKQANEDVLPDESIEIDVTAQIYFDVATGFGQFGTYSLNLVPTPDESTWLSEGTQEGEVWGGRAYLRLVNIQGKTANVQVYDSQKRKITSIQLSEGAGAKQVNLPGGVKFLENLLSLKLERISTDSDKAKLIIDNKGKVFETTVVKGMRPFQGSNWVVDEIFSDNVVFVDDEGNQKVFEDLESEEPLESPQKAPEENILETNPILSQLEKVEKNLYIKKEGFLKSDIYYKHIGSGIWKWSEDKQYWYPTTTYEATEGGHWYDMQGDNTLNSNNKKIVDELQKLKPEPPREFQEQTDSEGATTTKITTETRESITYYNKAINAYKDAIFSNPSDYSLLYDSYLGMARAYDKIGLHSKEDILKAIDAYQKAEGYKQFNEEEAFNFEAKYEELNKRLSEGLRTVNLGDGIHATLLDIPTPEEKKDHVIYTVNNIEKPPVNSGDPLDFGSAPVDEYANEYNWIIEGLNPDNIVIRQRFVNPSSTSNLREESRTLKLGQTNPVPYNGQKTRDVYIKKIDITSSAIITVSPGTKNNYGTSQFTIHLPIEERLIKWTPEEIDKKIAATDKAMKKLDGIITKLGNVVKTWKTVCFSVFAFLTLKNAFFTNPTGRRLAVERMEKDCSAKVEDKTSDFFGAKVEDCIKGRKEELDTWVESSKQAVKDSEELFKDFKWDDDAAVEKVAKELDMTADELRTMQEYGYVSAKDLRDAIHASNSGTGWDEDATTRIADIKRSSENADQVKSALSGVEGYEDMTPREKRSKIDEIRAAVDKTIEKVALDTHLDEEDEAAKAFIKEKYPGKEGTKNLPIYEDLSPGEEYSYYTYAIGTDGKTQKVKLKPIKRSSTEILSSSQGDYYEDGKGNVYLSSRVVNDHSREYRGSAQVYYDETNKNRPMYIPFNYDPAKYGDSFSDIPKIVGFANYVEVYVDEQGKYHYTIINVGQDGRLDIGADGEVLSGGDDKVIVHSSLLDVENPTARTGSYSQLSRDIQAAYRDADKGPRNGNEVTVRGKTYLAGKIATKTKSIMTECKYLMPETDCKILFGVCDPVMCPVSRFNLGGNWKIGASVVETGIIGSIILGLPNFNLPYEPVPICLTGVHAGLENIYSMLGSFRDCLETAKVNGEPVGICNEIRSVYMCDILWHEALALVDIFGSLRQWIASNIFGAGSSGAIDVSWQSSWDQLSDNVDFFKKEYARSAFAAFHSRSTNEIGSELCKAAIFGQYPGGGDLLAQLTEPESPPQFTGWFEEDLYTAVDPETMAELGESGFAQGQSAYRIYYHIYAGRNTDVRYNVYLKDAVGNVMPATDPKGFSLGGQRYLRKGETVDQSFVLTARPPGFNQMCISINGREECGFSSVSSAFSMNYLKDQLIKGQIEKKNIDSADKCIPDEPHYQPGFVQHGIKRVCSVYDPDGVGDDWALVGSCGYDERDRFLGDCYLFARDIDLYDLSYNTTDTLYNISKKILENRTIVDDEDIKKAREELERIKTEEEAAEDRSEFIDDYEKLARWDVDNDITSESHYRIAEIYRWMAGQRAKGEKTQETIAKADRLCTIKYDSDKRRNSNWGYLAFAGDNDEVSFKFKNGKWVCNPLNYKNMDKEFIVSQDNCRALGEEEVDLGVYSLEGAIYALCNNLVGKSFEQGVNVIISSANSRDNGNDDKIKVIVDEKELYKPGHGDAVAAEVLKHCGVGGTDISFSDLASLMEYLRSHTVDTRLCRCGDNCDDYAKWIIKYSEEYNVDPVLTLAVMLQESSCDANICGSDGCTGLMQTTPGTAKDICGVNDIEDLVGVKNAEENIECGVKILKAKYESFKNGLNPTGDCDPETREKYASYRGWEAALRGYNGRNCNEKYVTGYVEQVMSKYNQLKSMLGGSSVSLIQEQTITGEVQVEIQIPEAGCEKEDEDTCDNFNGCYLKLNKGMFGWDWASDDDCKDCTKLEKCQDIKNFEKCGESLCAGLAGKSCEWDNSKSLCIEGTTKAQTTTKTEQAVETITEVVKEDIKKTVDKIKIEPSEVKKEEKLIEVLEETEEIMDVVEKAIQSETISEPVKEEIKEDLEEISEALEEVKEEVKEVTAIEEVQEEITLELYSGTQIEVVEQPITEEEIVEEIIEVQHKLIELAQEQIEEEDDPLEPIDLTPILDKLFAARTSADSIKCLENLPEATKLKSEKSFDDFRSVIIIYSDLETQEKEEILEEVEPENVCKVIQTCGEVNVGNEVEQKCDAFNGCYVKINKALGADWLYSDSCKDCSELDKCLDIKNEAKCGDPVCAGVAGKYCEWDSTKDLCIKGQAKVSTQKTTTSLKLEKAVETITEAIKEDVEKSVDEVKSEPSEEKKEEKVVEVVEETKEIVDVAEKVVQSEDLSESTKEEVKEDLEEISQSLEELKEEVSDATEIEEVQEKIVELQEVSTIEQPATEEEVVEEIINVQHKLIELAQEQLDMKEDQLEPIDLTPILDKLSAARTSADAIKCLENIHETTKHSSEESFDEFRMVILDSSNLNTKEKGEVLAEVETEPVCEVIQTCEAVNVGNEVEGQVYGCHADNECRDEYSAGQLDCGQGESCCRPTCEATYSGRECTDTNLYECSTEPTSYYCPGDSSVVCCERGEMKESGDYSITISLSDAMLYLYDSNGLVKRYPMIVGKDCNPSEQKQCELEERAIECNNRNSISECEAEASYDTYAPCGWDGGKCVPLFYCVKPGEYEICQKLENREAKRWGFPLGFDQDPNNPFGPRWNRLCVRSGSNLIWTAFGLHGTSATKNEIFKERWNPNLWTKAWNLMREGDWDYDDLSHAYLSHGCMRTSNEASLELYELIKMGTQNSLGTKLQVTYDSFRDAPVIS